VELLSVSCREVAAKRSVELGDMPPNGCWRGTQELSGHRDVVAGQLIVVARLAAEARDAENADARKIAEVSATFALRYAVPADVLAALTEDDVRDFADMNGLYNAWPYWRELLQSTTGRIGLHGVVAPVFRIPIGSPKKDEEVAK
jgi:hypothetical protein